MGVEDNLSNVLGIEHKVIEEKEVRQEIIPYEIPEEPIDTGKDQEDDYRLARRVLRNLITKGNDAIDEISVIARQNESPRGFEVQSTLIKTVADVVKDLYDIQKKTRDLRLPDPEGDPRVKNKESNISVENAVFVGSAAELLSAIKKKKEEDGTDTV